MPAVGEDRAQVTLVVPPDARVVLVGHDAWMAEGDFTTRLTLPESPKRLARVICSVFEEPELKDSVAGPVRLKSDTVTFRKTLCVKEPKVPDILRV